MNNLIDLQYYSRLDSASGTLYCAADFGFFANCHLTLMGMFEMVRITGKWPLRIDFSEAFSLYRSEEQRLSKRDLYPFYFLPPTQEFFASRSIPLVEHHGLYRFLNYKALSPILSHYFEPSLCVKSKMRLLTERHSIDFNRTIGVFYRGTDKNTEVRVANPFLCLNVTRGILKRNPGFRVLIQTDELNVREMFCNELGDLCFYIPEIPVSSNGNAVHLQDDSTLINALKTSPEEKTLIMIATVQILSKMKYLVNTTGNMALWIALWRGHSKGAIQFDRFAELENMFSVIFLKNHLNSFFKTYLANGIVSKFK